MANVQLPGFIPVSVGGNTVELVRMRVLDNNTTAIFKGDALDAQATGDVIVTATADAAIHSVQWGGASFQDATTGFRVERTFLPAATRYTDGTALNQASASYVYGVEDLAAVRFKASVDGAIAVTGLGINYKMVLGAGSTSNGLSGHELSATTPAVTATFPWRLHEPVLGDPKSDPTLADAWFICSANAVRRNPSLEVGGSLGT